MAPRIESRYYDLDEIVPLLEASTEGSQRTTSVADTIQAAGLTWRAQIQAFVFEYGPTGVCTHLLLSIIWFAPIYAGISSGVAVSASLQIVGFTVSSSNAAGSFFLAFSIFKALTPVRWTSTLAIMPAVIRVRRRVRNLRMTGPSLRSSTSSQHLLSLE